MSLKKGTIGSPVVVVRATDWRTVSSDGISGPDSRGLSRTQRPEKSVLS
jgi:hypothetical protein